MWIHKPWAIEEDKTVIRPTGANGFVGIYISDEGSFDRYFLITTAQELREILAKVEATEVNS